MTTGKELHRVSTSHDGTSQIAFAADGKTIVSLGETGAVRLWETATFRLLLQLATPAVSLCVALSPDGKTIATGGSDGVLRLWKSGTNREIQRSPDRHIPPEEELQHRVWNVAFSPNGNFVAGGGTTASCESGMLGRARRSDALKAIARPFMALSLARIRS